MIAKDHQISTHHQSSYVDLRASVSVMYGHYAQYLNQMSSFIKDNDDTTPVFNVSYEEMKTASLQHLTKMSWRK